MHRILLINDMYMGNGEAGNSITTNAGLIPPVGLSEVPEQQQQPGADTEQDKMFDFSQARIHLMRIVDDWNTEVEDTEVRRKTRDVELDVEGLRQKGDLDEDETIVPVRTIDTNIQREIPAYVNYLTNSRRLCTFRCLSTPGKDGQNIEKEFTEGMTYTAWNVPHFKEVDGAETHGWASVEVVFDSSKPLNVGLEYIAHDKLFFPRTVENFQDAPRVIRAYDVTILKLKEWVRTFGFDEEQVDLLIQTRQDNIKENETVRIYKCYFKKEGVVYVSWFSLTEGVSNWLKKPIKHFIGIRTKQQVPTQVPQPDLPVSTEQGIAMIPQPPKTVMQEQWVDEDVKQYPIFKLDYKESEKPKEVDHKGRVFYDEPKQEAQTAIQSGFINGLTRASNVYASPSQEDGSGSSLKELEDVKLSGGRILSRPMTFWSPPYPDALIIRTLQYMDTANSEETNQVNFASMNREDSRKTAKEISAAQQQQQILNSVQLAMYSTHIREVYSFCWLIVQSQALQGNIRFLLIPNPQYVQALQQMQQTGVPPEQMLPQLTRIPKFINDDDTISETWEVRAAGDIDVVQRQEKIQMMMQMWPLVQGTPLAAQFLADLIKIMFPDVGDRYAQVIMQQDMVNNMKGLLGGLAHIVDAVIQQHPEVMNSINPQEKQQLMSMLQQAGSLSGTPPPNKVGGGQQQMKQANVQSINPS